MARSANIGSMSVTIRADTNPFTKGLATARKQLATFSKSVGKAVFSVKGLAAALAGTAFGAMVKDTLAFADSLGKASARIGVTTQALHGLRHAAQLSGATTEVLDKSLQRMSANLSLAAANTGPAVNMLRQLGLNAGQLASMSPDQQILAIADAIKGLPTPGQQAAAAMAIFGEEGVQLLNMLQSGGDGIRGMAEELNNLGGALSAEGTARAAEANDALLRLDVAVNALKVNMAAGLAPVITQIANGLASFIGTGEKLGFLADIVHTLKLAFMGLRVMVTSLITGLVEKFDTLQKVIVEVVNKIPGVEIKSSAFVSNLAQSLQTANAQTQKDFQAALIAPTPSEQMRSSMQSAAPVLNQSAVSANPNAAGGIMGALGGLLDKGKMKAQRFAMEKGFQAKMLGQFASFMGRNMMQQANAIVPERLNNASIGAVDATSRAGFSQRVKAMRNDPQFRIQKDQLAQLKQIANNTKGSEPAAAAGFA